MTQRHIKSGRGTTVVKSILLVTQFIYDAEIFNTKVMFIGTQYSCNKVCLCVSIETCFGHVLSIQPTRLVSDTAR